VAGGEDVRGSVDLVRLTDPDDEPRADHDRDHDQDGASDRHGRDHHRSAKIAGLAEINPASDTTVIVPNWNGREWLPDCLASLEAQRLAPAQVVVVDNGSRDRSVEYLRAQHPDVRVLELERNTGFAYAVNRGIEAAETELVAVLNTDVVLEPDWLARMVPTVRAHQGAASVACKMLSLEDRGRVYDAGDVLRRDGACEQRGRFLLDDGRWDRPGEVFGACAGAAIYRRAAVLEAGGFDERYFAYLEDVDLALRLRMAGWSCRYEPAVALHAGEGSSGPLPGGHQFLITRNTVLLVVKSFPLRWLPLVVYRQLGWAWHALLERRLGAHLSALAAALPLIPSVVRERRRLRGRAWVPIEVAVPARPIRGRRAGGHPAQHRADGPPAPRTLEAERVRSIISSLWPPKRAGFPGWGCHSRRPDPVSLRNGSRPVTTRSGRSRPPETGDR
jgi:GT2 family glycosyltransferase